MLVRHWRSEFLQHAETAFDERTERQQQVQRIAELERLVGQLTLELEIAKASLPA